jgi:hypothetical protein
MNEMEKFKKFIAKTENCEKKWNRLKKKKIGEIILIEK